MNHFQKFKETLDGRGPNFSKKEGRSITPYIRAIKDLQCNVNRSANGSEQEKFSRECLFDMTRNGNKDIAYNCAAILAWGGMRLNSFRSLVSCGKEWLNLCQCIREGGVNREEAYDKFAEIRKDKKLKGMGPAFFTKLIYFLMPRGDGGGDKVGYIMDQWVSCGVNLIAEKRVVLLDAYYKRLGDGQWGSSFLVSDINTKHEYENYCTEIEKIASRLKCCPEKVEWYLMAADKKGKEWRNHVKENRRFLA